MSGSSNYRVLGSRHIGITFHVRNEEEIKEILDRLWKEHHSATHICYAWKLGYDDLHYRVNDDGEPSGTGGRPIYGQILSAQLTNVLVVVIRYFGGTKLGTGGLIDAYKTAAAQAIEESVVEEREAAIRFRIQYEYAAMTVVMESLKQWKFEKIAMKNGAHVILDFRLAMSYAELFKEKAGEWGIRILEEIPE